MSNTERDSTYLLENSRIPLQWYKANWGQQANRQSASSPVLRKGSVWFERGDKRGEKGLGKKGRKQGGISAASGFIVSEGEWTFSAPDNSHSEKGPGNILPEKQNKTPSLALKFSKDNHGQRDPSSSHSFQRRKPTLDVDWILWNGVVPSGSSLEMPKPFSPSPLEPKKTDFSPPGPTLTRTAEAENHDAPFLDSCECWLGFYRHFSHYKNSHYKNCKIKGKLQIRCWVFITELIKTQTKQKLWYKTFATSRKTTPCMGSLFCGFETPDGPQALAIEPFLAQKVSILHCQWTNPETILTTYLISVSIQREGKKAPKGCMVGNVDSIRKFGYNSFHLGKSPQLSQSHSSEAGSPPSRLLVCSEKSDTSLPLDENSPSHFCLYQWHSRPWSKQRNDHSNLHLCIW